MKRPRVLIVISAALILVVFGLARADEGMWLYNFPPTAKIKAKYGFELTKAWLDHTRLSSVRFDNGGSGSFVSPDGLVFTNHHIAAECVEDLSNTGKDYMKTGFYAKTHAEEAKCPDLELNVLENIEDVTDKVKAAGKPSMSVAQQGEARRSAMSTIEQDCVAATHLRCDVITFYSGAIYHLYQYKKYTDVRLVFAPEFAAAFFGGDPDNFEYPRYDLDISFFRVYENNQPVHLDNYFKWSTSGLKEGDLVFVSGNPGSTGRLNTMAQLEFLRDTAYPLQLESLARRDALLKKFSATSTENARIAQGYIFGIENGLKAIKGYDSGLLDKSVMARKAADEDKMRHAVASDPAKKAQYGDPWPEIAKTMDTEKQIYLALTYFERRGAFRGDLAGIARALVRAAAERSKPNGERLREFRDSALPSLEQGLFSMAPLYKSLDKVLLADSLAEAQEKMPDSALLKRILNGKSPADAAAHLIDASKLDDVAVRKQLYNGGQAAITASTDPLVVLMREVEPEARAARKRYDDEVDAVVTRDGASIANIRFATEGTNGYPDATFTLRLSYGAVRGYTEDGRGVEPKGAKLPFFTTIGGAFEHAQQHNSQPPYALPQSWLDAKSKLDLSTPLNVVQTSDIIGGNSGSPVVNTSDEVVGIIFDGDEQSLPWNFAYDNTLGRAIQVDSRGILEALRHIYNAGPLAGELTGSASSKR